MVRLGIRALIGRISRRQTTSVPSTHRIPIMVYSYAAPFETGKLKVSDVHSLQLVSFSLALQPPFPPAFLFYVVCLTCANSYEVSGNRDGAPGAFHASPGYPASTSALTAVN
jgi:hypothetical protein